MEDSMKLLLQRYTDLIQQYELLLSQNQIKAIKTCERQLSFLVQTTNSFFSYGLPSGVSKTSLWSRKVVSDDETNMATTPKEKPKPEYFDFQLIQRVL